MNRRVKVPIRVKPSVVREHRPITSESEVTEAVLPVSDPEIVEGTQPVRSSVESNEQPAAGHTDLASPQELESTPGKGSEESESLEMWRDQALRLQAEMENFRKRQQRLADERITADRERLLRAFLEITDNLGRALDSHDEHAGDEGTDGDRVRQGVVLIHRAMQNLLTKEGVEPIEAIGQPFDPTWHEAVSVVPHEQVGAAPDTVVEVVQKGYRIGDRLLRPARVIVAQ